MVGLVCGDFAGLCYQSNYCSRCSSTNRNFPKSNTSQGGCLVGADHNLLHLLTASLCAEEAARDLGDLGSRKSRAASSALGSSPKELTISPSTKPDALQSF